MSTAELVEQIDAKWTKDGWAIHRRHDAKWMVHGPRIVFSDDTIEGALKQAAEHVPLPEIPQEPCPMGTYEVKKSGTRWDVHRNGRMLTGGYPTKKEATAVSQKVASRESEAYREWASKYAHYVATHTEGVDFRYSS